MDPEHLESTGRKLIEGGRPDLVEVDPAEIDWSKLEGRPWARLALAAALIAKDARSELAVSMIASAKRGFASRRESEGVGYCAYVAGTRCLGIGDFRSAVAHWRDARERLGDRSPVGAHALTHLSLSAYHDGDLATAAALAEDAVSLARLRIDRRGEGLALIYRALICLAMGDIGASLDACDSADRVFAELIDPTERYEWPLVDGLRAAAFGHRGDYDGAYAAGAEALRRAEVVGTRWYAGMALAAMAEFCVESDPQRALADGRAALEIMREVGDPWWESTALRAMGVATDLLGQPTGAVRLIHEAAECSPGPFERARCHLALAEVHVRHDRPGEARPLIDECLELFRAAPADLLLCRTLGLLVAAEPDRGPAARDEARSLRRADPAFDRVLKGVWARGRSIRVSCIGSASITLDGEPAQFLTHNAERAFFILALADDAGIHQEVLSEALWPGAPADRAKQRVRTLLWQVRNALGEDAWHIRRRGEVLYLDSTDVDIDIHAALAEAASIVVATAPTPETNRRRLDLADVLERPILGPYQYEPWAEPWLARAHSMVLRLRSLQKARAQPMQPAL